ncbi:MAG: hypothetical protein KG028_12800 [Actinobacteria bacterium]|jgi:hypothetical protein|nr:hypothetical protein [Actinomycetota bacterium]
MPVEEQRRVALHNQIAAAWGEEAAQTLFDLLTPAGHEVATRADLDAGFASVDARFAAVDARFDALEQRMDDGFARADERLESAVNRISATFERRISDAVNTQTRTLVWSQLAALVTIAALAFGLR